jgi:hypothetical protein
MKFTTRRDEYSYFLGFVARTQSHLLHEAVEWFSVKGYSTTLPEGVFEFCPFNDSSNTILTSYTVFEKGKRSDLGSRIIGLMEEYLFLVSDFEPPCCGDGRTFYEKTSDGQIVLGCDRCGRAYSLEERTVEVSPHIKMNRSDFEEIFGKITTEDWPYHAKLRARLVSSPFLVERIENGYRPETHEP